MFLLKKIIHTSAQKQNFIIYNSAKVTFDSPDLDPIMTAFKN